jgi:hypothetical protein
MHGRTLIRLSLTNAEDRPLFARTVSIKRSVLLFLMGRPGIPIREPEDLPLKRP